MRPVEFPGCNTTFAKDQPPYLPLPACKGHGPRGMVTTCWRLSWRERLRVLLTGAVWAQQLTFREPLQPQLLRTTRPTLFELEVSKVPEAQTVTG